MYELKELAPGSYDVLRDGEIIAALVKNGPNGVTWSAELLEDLLPERRPAPFVQLEHRFGTFDEACRWLGVSE